MHQALLQSLSISGSLCPFSPSAGAVIEVTLNLTDKAALQQLPGIATVVNNTYLSVSANGVLDPDGFSIVEIPFTSAIQASQVVPDTEPPEIINAALDMNSGVFSLSASEPVGESSVVITAFTLQNTATDPTASYTLQSSILIRITDFTNLVIGISTEDLNNIKAAAICSKPSNCFLTYDDAAIADTFGAPAVNRSIGLFVTLTADTTPPALQQFRQFNRALGTIRLTFSETINSSSFTASGVTLQALFDSGGDVMMHTLTGGIITKSDVSVNITLSSADMSAIQLNPFLCTSRGNCYITIESSAFTDIAGNSITPVSTGLLVDEFIFDTVPPMLLNFTLDLEDGNLTLTFSEPVSSIGFNIDGITILSGNATNGVTLTTSSTMSSAGTEITVTLSSEDLNRLKDSEFATSSADTFIALTSSTAEDLALTPNAIVPVLASDPLQSAMFIPDTSPPMVLNFTFDLNSDQILLTFDEPIQDDEIISTAFVLTGLSGMPSVALELGNASTISVSDVVVVRIDLLRDSVIAIKSLSNIATSTSDTFLNISDNAVLDINDNFLESVNGLQASSFTPDTTLPELLSFTLNLVTDTLIISFSDVVNPSTLDTTGITIQSAQSRIPGAFYTLTGASTATTSTFGYDVTIGLNSDALPIRENPNFGTSVGNTYITITASTIDGARGDDNLAITNGKGLQASALILDSAPPEFVSFTLDMDTGILLFSFTDFIANGSVNISGILLQDAPTATPGRVFRLTDGVVQISGASLTITLSENNLNGLKSVRNLATSVANTYVTLAASTIEDTSNNQLVPVLDGNGQQVASFGPDNTRPSLTSFVLDRDRGVLLLTFTEFVNAAGLRPDQIRLQSRSSINVGDTTSIPLTGSTPASEDDSNVIELRLPIPVLQTFSTSFGDMVLNTYLTTNIFAVNDLNNNPVRQIPATAAQQAASVIPDTSDPILESFDLDLAQGLLIMTWSKPVNVSGLNVADIIIQNQATALAANMYSLTISVVISGDGIVVTIRLSVTLGRALKTSSTTATSIDDTFVQVSAGLVNDLSSRPSVEISDGSAKQASNFVSDNLPPDVDSFTLDLNTGDLTITFDEFITSLDPSGIIIVNDPSSPTANYTLSNSTVTSITDNVVVISLGSEDQEGVKAAESLGTTSTNTFLALDSGSATDASSNSIITMTTFTVGGTIIPDSISPQLNFFSIDLSTEILALTFSEAVDAGSINLTSLTLLSNPSTMPTASYQLTANSRVVSPNGRIIEIHLIGTDASAIKANSGLATVTTNAYISILGSFVADTSGNFITPIELTSALMATAVSIDNSPPMLQSFTLDLSSNLIALQFSEALNISTFTPTEITLFSGNTSTAVNITLTGGTFPLMNAARINLSLTAVDASYLKGQSQTGQFASSVMNTYISITSSTAEDTSGNVIQAIPIADLFPATAVILDTAGPQVVAFTLDMDNGNLTLHFSELINISSLMTTLISLHGSNNGSDNYHNITTVGLSSLTSPTVGSLTLSSADTVVSLILSSDDLNSIKGEEICNTTTDCFLAHRMGVVNDDIGNTAPARENTQRYPSQHCWY